MEGSMGQAKRRGTYEERVQSAITRKQEEAERKAGLIAKYEASPQYQIDKRKRTAAQMALLPYVMLSGLIPKQHFTLGD
jgi:hypothetical protein